jgi:colanic acid/amylovoran biosynthesis glycosyltransferase
LTGGAASKPRVGYVLKKFPRLSETFVLGEILGLEAEGVDVRIWSLTAADEGRFHSELGRLKAATTYAPSPGSTASLLSFEAARDVGATAKEWTEALDYARLLPPEKRAVVLLHGLLVARDARKDGLDRLHAHFMTVASHVARVARIFGGPPFTVTAHAKDVFRDSVDKELFRATAEAADAVVTVCDYNAAFLRERLLDGSPARVVRIYNGLPLAEVAAARAAAKEREEDLVLAVGRLVPKKGFDRLIDAAATLARRGSAFRVEILGDGEERARLSARVERLGLEGRVVFRGAVSRDVVLDRMARARVLAAPCVRGADGNQDALPTTLVEALAIGLPSVATPVAGIPEIVEHEREGLLSPEGDVEALADALERVLTDDALRARLSENGPGKAARKFDRRSTTRSLLDLFLGRG